MSVRDPGPSGPRTTPPASPPGGHASFINNTTNVQLTPRSNSYSSALRLKQVTPKEDQAIIINTVKEIKVVEYVTELIKFVDSKYITHASKLSHDRLCIYFTTKEVVDDFIVNHNGLNLNGNFYQARRLSMPAQRVVISNVSAHIPFIAIENLLKSQNFKLVSPITSLSAGLKVPGLEHIQSFRCQVYIALEANDYLPDSIVINHEGRERRIYLSKGDFKCFKCGQTGHQAANCQENIEQPQLELQEQNKTVETVHSQTTNKTPTPENTNFHSSLNKQTHSTGLQQTNIDTDRQVSPTEMELSDSSEDDTDSHKSDKKKKRNRQLSLTSGGSIDSLNGKKKKKREIVPDPENALFSIKSYFDEEMSPPMTFNDLNSYLIEAKGSEDPCSILLKYTDTPIEIIDYLKPIVTKIEHVALKERVKRLIKKFDSHYRKNKS